MKKATKHVGKKLMFYSMNLTLTGDTRNHPQNKNDWIKSLVTHPFNSWISLPFGLPSLKKSASYNYVQFKIIWEYSIFMLLLHRYFIYLKITGIGLSAVRSLLICRKFVSSWILILCTYWVYIHIMSSSYLRFKGWWTTPKFDML